MLRSRARAVLLVFLGFLILYVATAAPGILFGDSGELQAAALTHGIPHATGYPTFVMTGGLFARAFAHPAFGVNVMSAFFGAATAALLVVLLGELGVGVAASVAAACLLGLSFSPWRTSLRAEVYTQADALALLAGWLTLIAHRTRELGRSLLAAVLLGLTLTGHLIFAPAVAVLGLSLAWLVARQPRPVPKLLALLGAFLLGLSPYLYLMIAESWHPAINYYDQVRIVNSPFGHPLPGFETPWKRLGWMLTGHNSYPVTQIPFNARLLWLRPLEASFIVFGFELGPVALIPAFAGGLALWRRHRGASLSLGLCLVLSSAFAMYLADNPMLELFLLPALMIVAMGFGAGLDPLLHSVARRAGRFGAGAVAVALVGLAAVTSNGIREYAEVHPLTRWRFQVLEEDRTLSAGWLPSMRRFDVPERYGRRAFALAPQGALVVGSWSDVNVFRYLSAVEHLRPDLTLQQTSAFSLPERMRVWQASHDVSTHPFVFTELVEEMRPYYAIAETLEVMPGRRLYVQRTPIPDAAHVIDPRRRDG
jgi:hypothetical protein